MAITKLETVNGATKITDDNGVTTYTWLYGRFIIEADDDSITIINDKLSPEDQQYKQNLKYSDQTEVYSTVTAIEFVEYLIANEIFFSPVKNVVVTDKNGLPIDVQNPFPVDGDTVYCKDIDLVNSDIDDFTGEVCDLFNDYTNTNVAASVGGGGVNPKSFLLVFHRPIVSSTVGVGSPDDSISNAKLTLTGLAGDIIKVVDFSTDDTKKGVQLFQFEQKIFISALIEFYTDDEVVLGGAGITKSTSVSIDAINGIVSHENSTNELLIADAIFTGVPVDTKNYGIVICSVYSDVESATNGLIIEYSTDETNWFWNDAYTIAAATGKTFSVQTQARYLRVRYINGSTGQATFQLEVTLKPVYIKPSSHRIGDPISAEDDAELIKAVLTGADPTNVFVNVKTTNDGDLRISDNSSGLAISQGNVAGTTFQHKFGLASDFDTGDGNVTIWDGANDAGIDQMQYVYSATNDIDSLISTNVSDTVDIVVVGLDINYAEVTQTITLTGQTRVALTTDLIRVYRMYNDDSTDLLGVVSCYVNGTATAGVVDDSADVRALISSDNNQTLMAVYTVPAGKTAYLREWYANIAGNKKTSNYIIELRIRPFGKVFRLAHVSALSDAGTSYIQHKFEEPPIATEKSDVHLTCRLTESVTAAGVAAGFDLVLVDD